MRVLLLSLKILFVCFLITFIYTQLVKAQTSTLPIYAAYVSEALEQQCNEHKSLDVSNCQLNILDGYALSDLASSIPQAQELSEGLSLSEYEVLIGNAQFKNKAGETTLTLEISTVWRSVPLDEHTFTGVIYKHNIDATARLLLSDWVEHLAKNEVLDARKIHTVLQASNYEEDLITPAKIGDFVKLDTAIYRDPLAGSLTRYTHPNFNDAILDVIVYPLSPFPLANGEVTQTNNLANELKNESEQIKARLLSAHIDDYLISEVEPATVSYMGKHIAGHQIEVTLNAESVPVYSTQYIFMQNDKIIKLSGNVPKFMMQQLVQDSLPNITVPAESIFMQRMRQG